MVETRVKVNKQQNSQDKQALQSNKLKENGVKRGRGKDKANDPQRGSQLKKQTKNRKNSSQGTNKQLLGDNVIQTKDLSSPRKPKDTELNRQKNVNTRATKGSRNLDNLFEAVVKVFCVHTEFNYSQPWQKKRQYSSYSSGFVIDGRRVLTNAHSVQHNTQIKVKRRGSDEKFVAKVLAVGLECDIAMLTIADDRFWENQDYVIFGELPNLQDSVIVLGYPVGGDTMSVTSGVVSRIEVTQYEHGHSELLGMQIDAAINGGNSGGPAFNADGQCVGIAFQSLRSEEIENISYVIPTPIIKHFIKDYELNGKYTGFPVLGIEYQKLENSDLRKFLGLDKDQKGVLIRNIEPLAPLAKLVKKNDVLLKFGDMEIGIDGTVPFRSGQRISFVYLISQKYADDQASIEVLSNKKTKKFQVVLKPPNRLVPLRSSEKPPSYFIIAGLVFTPFSVQYLKSEYGKEFDIEAPVKLLDRMMYQQAQEHGQQVVILSQVMASDVNVGYEDINNLCIKSFNNIEIRNLKQLVGLCGDCEEEYLNFELEFNTRIVLKNNKAKQSTKEILETYCITSDRSKDLM